MRHIHPLRVGIALGTVIGLWHLLWVTLVAIGWAKPIMDFILRLHFLEITYRLAPFALGTAATLVALTFGAGLLFGIAFALMWNWLVAAQGADRSATLDAGPMAVDAG